MLALLIFIQFLCNVAFEVGGVNPDVLLNMEQLVKKHGYPIELHEVVTKDGYFLNLYRIPRGLGEAPSDKIKSAVLFVHGQGGSPHNFVALGPKTAPAYYFADRGFDVWLFCSRGVECQNPKKHRKLDWNLDPLYWDFSFHEVGLYDLSASIDVVLNKSGQKKIFVISHSVGTLAYHALMSEKPQYNDKIKINGNYAPVLILHEVDFPAMQMVFRLSNLFKNIYHAMGMHEFLPPFTNPIISDTMRKMCADKKKWFRVCKVLLWCFGSHISHHIEDEVVEYAFYVFPRFSIRQLTHFMDNVNHGDFRKYDYGIKMNMALYGTKFPPLYNLSSSTAPNAIFHGTSDALTTQADMAELGKVLPNAILDYEMGPEFVHLDFLFAKNATRMVYEGTVRLFKNYDAGIVSTQLAKEQYFVGDKISLI